MVIAAAKQGNVEEARKYITAEFDEHDGSISCIIAVSTFVGRNLVDANMRDADAAEVDVWSELRTDMVLKLQEVQNKPLKPSVKPRVD